MCEVEMKGGPAADDKELPYHFGSALPGLPLRFFFYALSLVKVYVVSYPPGYGRPACKNAATSYNLPEQHVAESRVLPCLVLLSYCRYIPCDD